VDGGFFATKNFQDVIRATSKINTIIKPQETLIVFDIDNTLLKFSTDFGSEQWFLWQSEMLNNKFVGLPLVSNTLANILEVQSWIYKRYPMEIVDIRQKSWITQLKKQYAGIIALTSRSLNVHDATLREIFRNKLKFSSASELCLKNEGKLYLPYQLEHLNESGLTTSDVANFKLGPANFVVFDRGAFLTQGQNKGIMLKTLLHRMARKFKSVIFIDDRLKHIEAMRMMAKSVPEIMIYSIHFNLSETWTQPFLKGNKLMVEKQWCDFASWLDKVVFKDPFKQIYQSCF